MTMTNDPIIGKTVTLPRGEVVTVTGTHPKHSVTIVSDSGEESILLRRVAEELPETHRRASIAPIHNGEWPKEWHRQ